jgi:hypothetical protein
VLVAEHGADDRDPFEVAARVERGRVATAIARDAGAVGDLSHQVVATEGVDLRPEVEAPEERGVGRTARLIELRRAGEPAELHVAELVLPAQAGGQVGRRLLGITHDARRRQHVGIRVLERDRHVAAVLAELVREADLGLADQREGDRRLEVQRLGHRVLVHERGPRLSAEHGTDFAVRVPHAERVAVAEEVPSANAWKSPIDVGPFKSTLNRVWRACMRVFVPGLLSSSVGIVRGSKLSVEPISSKSWIRSTLTYPPNFSV